MIGRDTRHLDNLSQPCSLNGFRPTLLDDLTRVGHKGDGGYVLNERSIRRTQYLMSFGINDDWSFELDFLQRKPDAKVVCFDYSVSKSVFRGNMLSALNEALSIKFALLVLSFNLSGARRKISELRYWARTYRRFSRFLSEKNVRFYDRGISNEQNGQFLTFAEAFRVVSSDAVPEDSVFVKMDIEQSEFRVIPDLLRFERYINGMAIEFHDLDILWTKFVEVAKQLQAKFEITHIHGNNYGGLIPNSEIPRVLEITFLKKSLIREQLVARENVSYPLPELDSPNNHREKDYRLSF